jgi:hypothetical protein
MEAPKNCPMPGPDRSNLPQWFDAVYWRESRRPLVSLAFIFPALIAYEAGVVLLGPRAVRNGADVWLRACLDLAGFGQYFLLPLVTMGLLLAWHHMNRDCWQVSAVVLYGMLLECCVLGLTLVGLARLPGLAPAALSGIGDRMSAATWFDFGGWTVAARLIGFLGAGIYEEALFRLALLPLVSALWMSLGGSQRWRAAAAILFTSVAFSGAHYIGAQGELFEVYSFTFRFFAGVFFSLLFVYRGFGVAAGAHALYDIFVGLL